MVNTPGVGGYLVAWATSVVTLATLLVMDFELGPPESVVWILMFLTPTSIPFAVAGTFLVHHVCRGAPQQWRHVLAATAAGAMAGGFVALGDMGPVVLVPMAAASTALGRTVVIPVVWLRRDSARAQETG